MSMDYFFWRTKFTDGYCVLARPTLDRAWELDVGRSRLDEFPDDFVCHMHPDYPRDIQLSDNLFGSTLPVISEKTRQLLSEKSSNSLEFLPTRIVNHKGRMEVEPYFFLHPLDVCHCLDLEKSQVEWNEIDPSVIAGMEQCVFDRDRIPEDFTLFRLGGMGHNIVVREDLVQALHAANLTGLAFRDTRTYKGIG